MYAILFVFFKCFSLLCSFGASKVNSDSNIQQVSPQDYLLGGAYRMHLAPFHSEVDLKKYSSQSKVNVVYCKTDL